MAAEAGTTPLATLEPDRPNLHGSFSAARAPIVWIDPGDTVRFRTLDVSWGLEAPRSADAPRRRVEDREEGPALVGPVGVRGAAPGMTLEVRVERLVPGPWGWTYAGAGVGRLDEPLGVAAQPLHLVSWTVDVDAGLARSRLGELPLEPFLGVVGVAPPTGTTQSGWVPFAGGGNLDCNELGEGSTLYLPVLHEGALLSVGDGHARQGAGEVCGMAIECPMDEVLLRVDLHRDLRLTAPRARTRDGWLTFGFAAEVEDAVVDAVGDMLDLLGESRALDRADALALVSVAGDVRVTQLVNGARGVHVFLPDTVTGPVRPEAAR